LEAGLCRDLQLPRPLAAAKTKDTRARRKGGKWEGRGGKEKRRGKYEGGLPLPAEG